MDKDITINQNNNAPEKEKTKRTNKLPLILRTVLFSVLIVVTVWSIDKFKNLGKALAEYDKALKEVDKDASSSMKSWEKRKEEIAKIGIEEYAKSVGKTTEQVGIEKSAQQIGVEETPPTYSFIIQLDKVVQDCLNNKPVIQEAGIRCINVDLQNDISGEYKGYAAFDNGEFVQVKVGKDVSTGEYYFSTDLPSAALVSFVSNSTFPDYEFTTIGKAFKAFFTDPNWTTRISDNGSKFVEFAGKLKENLLLIEENEALLRVLQGEMPSWNWLQGDKICMRFAISHDGKSFELWSIQRDKDEPLRMNDWEKHAMIENLFEAIYELK